jgi:hypothetical protein
VASALVVLGALAMGVLVVFIVVGSIELLLYPVPEGGGDTRRARR